MEEVLALLVIIYGVQIFGILFILSLDGYYESLEPTYQCKKDVFIDLIPYLPFVRVLYKGIRGIIKQWTKLGKNGITNGQCS
jgi:hypothetical protein